MGTNIIKECSHRFSNGIVVVNTTPHPLNFLSPEEELVVVPSSVPEGEKAGPLVINARPETSEVRSYLVKTTFEPSPEGNGIIADIKGTFAEEDSNGLLMIVGSLAAANAFKDVVGMVPAPGFERVPPQEKRMSSEVFNVGDCW